jgi:hypothetical protein
VLVQGGSSGLVLSREGGHYKTTFVEAFPHNGFIRGEGATLQEAESSAWSQYVRQMSCEQSPGHEFERRHYTNGCGICKHCGAFRSEVFDALPYDSNREPGLIEQLLDRLSPQHHGNGV